MPVTGQRKSVKVFGCVEVQSARFLYHRDTVFNAATYLDFLEQVARAYYPRPVFWIQDNASYHKDREVYAWFADQQKWWATFLLPPYAPELNAEEQIWRHTRLAGTHNRYFVTVDELDETLTRVFRSIQHNPHQIKGYLQPFS